MRWFAALLMMLPGLAWGQAAVQQTGPVTNNKPVMWSRDHFLRQGASSGGDVAGKMITGGDAVVGARCSYSASTDANYTRICIDASTGRISIDGTDTPAALLFNVYGVDYPFPGTGNGNVVGPTPSVVNNVPLFNNTVGSLLKDSGYPLSQVGRLDLTLRPSALLNPTPGFVYVRAGGNDANDCLTDVVSGSHGPCATAQRALAVGLGQDAKSNVLTIDIGPGTFTAPIAVNGPNVGGTSSTNFVTAAASMPVVLLKGASSAATTIFGPATYLGTNYCYAILANGGAVVGLQNLSVQADGGGGSCNVSDLYIQAAQMWNFGDVVLKSATGNFISAEEHALFYNTAGTTTPGLTVQGSAYNGFNFDESSSFVSDSTVNINGAITLAGGCFVNLDYGSIFKITIPNPAFTNGATVSGRRFCLAGLSNMAIGNPPPTWFGSLGIVSNGSRYEAPDAVPCVGGAVGCPATGAPTGGGAGATYAISDGSGAYGGAVRITAGAGASASGGITIGFPYEMNRGACATFFTQGTGTWDARATIALNGFTTDQGLGISWDNNAVALTDTETYFIGWTCNTTQ